MITQPGLYLDMPTADYFGDCCPEPSLTQSIAKILLDRSPLHAWHAHPKLNPDFRADDDTKFDVGNIAHKLMIGRGKEIAVLEGFDDWRKAAAKEAREEMQSQGKLTVLGKHYARADKMVRAAREQLEIRGEGDLFADGKGDGEAVTIWQEGPIWLRQMLDWVSADRRTVVDFKTTDMSAAPQNLSRMMLNAGWHIQGAMAERGLDAVHPETAGRRRYLFAVQEAAVPYAMSLVEIDEAALTMGRKAIDMAAAQWRHCMHKNIWPGYPLEIQRPKYPGWAESQWLEREIAADDRRRTELVPDDLLAGG